MGKHKELSAEQYKEKFDELFSRINYIPQEGEKIVQCRHPHPPYWFISNKGYIFSAYKRNLEIVKPIFDRTGIANKSGERNGKSWRYGTRYQKSATAPLNRWDMGKMIVEYFEENEFLMDEETEVHHKKKRSNFSENEAQKCNRIDNLQTLPKSIHKELTKYASKTSKEIDEDMEKKIQKSGCPVYQFTQEQLQAIFINALQSCLKQGVQPVIYTTTITDDVSEIEAEAHPIKRVEFSN